MFTYSRRFVSASTPSIPQVFSEEVTNEDGSVSVHTSDTPFDSPYEGLDADSFKISAQIKAGVPLREVSPTRLGSSLDSVDAVNEKLTELSNSKK